MNDSDGRWWGRLRFTIFFLVLTILMHALFEWFHGWLHPADPYREPEGRAAKVFRSGEGDDPRGSPGDRLRLFYWYGE